MVSRLDRLFILLDTGSNESVRLAAAKQLGEVQRVQPDDLNYLLQRIKEYSSKSVWETRVAAGHATRCVLAHVEPWPKQDDEEELQVDTKSNCRHDITTKLIDQEIDSDKIFEQVNLEKIISQCQKLLSLDVIEVDESEQNHKATNSSTRNNRSHGNRRTSSKNDKEQLLRQRKLINKELGISMVDRLNLGVKSTDIVSNDDLVQNDDYDNKSSTQHTSSSSSSSTAKLSTTILQDSRAIIEECTSNYDKLLNKLYNKNIIYYEPKNQSLSKQQQQQQKKDVEIISSDTTKFSKYIWPLTDISQSYAEDLFNPSWEVRHGASIALREIVRSQGKYAGRRSELSKSSNDKINQLWLVDMALKSLIVLALDKFGDFLFDQVVAPVRENAAQLLGCCVANMSEINAYKTIKFILQMLDNSDWGTRHGGILGLKYSLNIVEKEFSKRLLQECFEPIFRCLGDSVDDVSAEAAASLVPVKDLMIEVIPDKAPKLIKFLWEHLADLDELTTSTSNIVLLLASLITSSSSQLEPSEITKSIPRLWSLLGHSSTTVRISVLKALQTLMKPQKSTCLSWMPEELIITAIRLIYQRSILENIDEVRPYLEDVWLLLIKIDENQPESQTEQFKLLKVTSQYLNYWLCLILQPTITPIDRGSPMWLNIGPDGSKSEIKPDGEVYIGSSTFNADTINQQNNQVTKTRLLATRLLGSLYANLVTDLKDNTENQYSKDALKYLADMFVHYIRTKSANQRIISGWTLESWATHQIRILNGDYIKLKTILPFTLVDQLNLAIQEISLCYDELASAFTRLQQETRDFVSTLRGADIIVDPQGQSQKRTIYNINQIQSFCDINIEVELTRISSKKTTNCDLKEKQSFNDHELTKSQLYLSLMTKKSNLTKSLKSTQLSQKTLSTSVLSSLACAHISWRTFPKSFNLIINPLMDSIELEEEQSLQIKSIDYLVTLIDILCEKPQDNFEAIDNILKRLIEVLSCKALSMIFELNNSNLSSEVPNSARCSIDAGIQSNGSDTQRIILLDNLQRKAELNRPISRRQSSINTSFNLKRSHSVTTSQELSLDNNNEPIVQEDLTKLQQQQQQQSNEDVTFDIKLRGSSIALNKLASFFGTKLPEKLPQFWKHITDDIRSQAQSHSKLESGFDKSSNDIKLIKSLRLLEVVGQSVHKDLMKHLLDLFDDLILLLKSQSSIIRHHSAHCIGVISKIMFSSTIDSIYKKIVPMLELSGNTLARCGSIEAIALIIERLQLELVPRIDMFIIHVLRRMSDQNDQVRLMATHCFGKLLSLMPLNLEKTKDFNEKDLNLEETKSNDNRSVNDEQRFIEQLLNPKKLDNYSVPFAMEAELRSYQQDGLNWLAFLNRFNLHGILCDEMGLGKTFMTICMVAADHFYETKKEKHDEHDAFLIGRCPPSLIVCPSTLTEHWLYEIDKFLPDNMKQALNPAAYSGSLNDRMNLRCRISPSNRNSILTSAQTTNTPLMTDISDKKLKVLSNINLVVASYDIVRNDIDFFKEMHWNYCVLDEGHIIKNGKTKLSRAIRLLNARHRLILSGTPIQNNVTELWSLFDFLMPGFLGSERQFNVRYTKPILQSRELKCSSRELEAGALAMESLHRQVLPFILRRLKEEVLDDLPPKIIQDYYCELSQLQHKLYEDFTKSKLCNNVTKKSIQELNEEDQQETSLMKTQSNSKSHVFQALQYLKNVCNHPKLVLTQKHPHYNEIKKSLETDKTNLDDINHSSKLKALKQLLIDCGIGISTVGNSNDDQATSQAQQQAANNFMPLESVVNQHRALIFCQIRSMLNIIENDLLKKHLPTVTYLKLDGSIPSNQRQSIVSRFNNDPSIDILLLTTQIGGLGLNLTGADTVIFVEHDWNPTKDLQAMDRAHRIGQKKVVNVYRLITKATLEEKIMGLQKFKTMVSNTVINQDNTGLGTMNVDQLLDLFDGSTMQDASGGDGKNSTLNPSSGGGGSKKSFIDLLPELWDQQQYETEYDLSNFVSSLKN